MGASIIVCTNNPVVVEAVSGALDHHGPGLMVCRSSLEVLAAASGRVVDVDVLILDLETPGLNGLLLISAIEELARGLRVVVVSTKPHLDAGAVFSTGVSYVPLTSHPSGGELLSTEIARLRERPPVFATRPEPYVVLKDLLEDRGREIQEELRSLRETLPAEIVDVKDAEEQSLDDLMRELNFALMEMKSDTLRQIDEAIRRLESGTYGVCVECAEEIPEARLRALPFVRLCRTCQEEKESREAAQWAAGLREPVLEELLAALP